MFKLCYSNDLATLIPDTLPMSKYAENPETWGQVVTASAFLARLQLFGANSNEVKEGNIPMGHYGITRSKGKTESLGNVVQCIPVAWRFKAMDISDKEAIISVYDPNSEGFKKIMNLSDNTKDSGCMYGPEFLVWLPSIKEFVTLFLNSKSARRVAPDLKTLLKRGATLKATLASTAKYKWHVPVVTQCSDALELPDSADLMEKANTFANPKETEIEKVESVGTDREQ